MTSLSLAQAPDSTRVRTAFAMPIGSVTLSGFAALSMSRI